SVHAVADVQDTALTAAPIGLGALWSSQPRPVERSTITPPPWAGLPTAVHAVRDVQDTASSADPSGAVRVGGVSDQPPARCTSARGVPGGRSRLVPTIMQLTELAHETSAN